MSRDPTPGKPFRFDGITLFESQGIALEDVICAEVVYNSYARLHGLPLVGQGDQSCGQV